MHLTRVGQAALDRSLSPVVRRILNRRTSVGCPRGLEGEWTILLPDGSNASAELVELILKASRFALNENFQSLNARNLTEQDARFLQTWPGEHYRFLAGVASVLGARLCVEVGTAIGLGALALRSQAESVATFDIIDVLSDPKCILTPEDRGKGIDILVGDLLDADVYSQYRHLLATADLIFLDGPKDGHFEKVLLDRLISDFRGTNKVIVIDDIKVLPMLMIWKQLDVPKFDATSLGHFTGTGVLLL